MLITLEIPQDLLLEVEAGAAEMKTSRSLWIVHLILYGLGKSCPRITENDRNFDSFANPNLCNVSLLGDGESK